MHRDMTWTDKLLVGKTLLAVLAATLLFTLQALAVHAVTNDAAVAAQDVTAIAHAGH
ncbi:MAG: hypothetical protein QM811_29790 [Pirellulales bacterium]